MVTIELVLIADGNLIQTSVIHAVSGHYSLYSDLATCSYVVIKFSNTTAYK